jgi:DNA-binding NtrC family response regulator
MTRFIDDPPVRTLRDIAHAEAWRRVWLTKLHPPGLKVGGKRKRADITTEMVVAAMELTGGNMTAAAKMLGTSSSTIEARMEGHW